MTGPVKPIGLALALQLAFGAGTLAAQQPADTLFPARPTGYLTDVAGVVDPASAATIDSLAARLRAVTGAEMAVVTLPTIGDYPASDVALAIGRAWGVGQAAESGDARRNAGGVVLLVPRREGEQNSGQIFISTGQGLEGIVTDAAAGGIRDAMIPELRIGQYGPGLVTGSRLLAALVARGLGAIDTTLTEPGRPHPVSKGLLLFLLLIGIRIDLDFDQFATLDRHALLQARDPAHQRGQRHAPGAGDRRHARAVAGPRPWTAGRSQ